MARLRVELLALAPGERSPAQTRRLAALLDAGHGCCVLRIPSAARLVQDSLLHFDGERYRLHAWVVMPNHVHVLFEPHEGWPLSRTVGSWKAHTGRQLAAKMTAAIHGARPRHVWQRDYWDRYMRDEAHYLSTVRYIHDNLVKAGLVARPEEWAWSSAAEREMDA